jgi:putative transposase
LSKISPILQSGLSAATKRSGSPEGKNILIDYERLQRLIGAGSYDQLKISRKGWIEEYLGDGAKNRQDKWTGSIAVGSRSFIENVKALLGFRAKGRAY